MNCDLSHCRACIGLAPINNMQLEHKWEHLPQRSLPVDATSRKLQELNKVSAGHMTNGVVTNGQTVTVNSTNSSDSEVEK